MKEKLNKLYLKTKPLFRLNQEVKQRLISKNHLVIC